MSSFVAKRLIVCVSLLAVASAKMEAEIISDLTGKSGDEGRALEIKAEKFWRSVLGAADAMKMEEHEALYQDTEKVIAALPLENSYVREALGEALTRLQRADRVILAQSMESSGLAVERLGAPAGGESAFSFLTGGQSFFAQAFRRFVDAGQYSERLKKHITGRQADILPLLQGTAAVTGNVLQDCRLASKRSFDVLKYDIYNKGVPKTPEAAKPIAYRLVDASSDTRRRFTQFIVGAATSIAQDVEGQHEEAVTTVIRTQLAEASVSLPLSLSSTDQLINL